jgi:shikimate kinase
MPELKNTIIYLIGIPAVGKYTTACAIARRTGAKLVDNHLINNPIFSVSHFDGTSRFPFPAEGWKYTGRIRRVVLDFIRKLGHPDDSFIFTNVLHDHEVRSFRTIELLAKRRKALFVPVWLKCNVSELRRRKDTPQRRRMLKEIDVSTIPYWTKEFRELDIEHPNRLVIDNTDLKPAQTAKLILDHIDKCGGKRDRN